MKTEAQLKKAIMRRVYGIYVMRQLWKPQVRVLAFVAIIAAVASSVSLPNIFANALHTSDFVGFSVSAVSHTTLYIQFGVLAAGLIAIATLVELVRPKPHANFYA